MRDEWREPSHEAIENALMSGWPLIHWARADIEGDRFHARVKDAASLIPGRSVVLRDAHTGERCFGTIIALNFEDNLATVVPAVR